MALAPKPKLPAAPKPVVAKTKTVKVKNKNGVEFSVTSDYFERNKKTLTRA